MRFYDANLSFGTQIVVGAPPFLPCHSIEELDAALDRAGAAGGLVRTLAQDVSGVVIGNELLREALTKAAHDLYGMYTIVPSVTREIPSAADLPKVMRDGKFAAIRLSPSSHKYLPKPRILSDYLEMAAAHKIPVMFDTDCGIELGEIWDILEVFPSLTAIIAYYNCWPVDRYNRPFLEFFENTYLDLSSMITDQGIEALYAQYGAGRLLYGSRFPVQYMGGAMLQLKCADIPEAAKESIAGGNLLRLVKEARL